jgi:hypothetical protein
MTAYDRILDQLERQGKKPQRRTGYAKALCPVHDDQDHSLSVRNFAQRAKIKCFVGCPDELIMEKLGFRIADLFNDPKGARYRYPDDVTIIRTPGKKFYTEGTSNRHLTPLYRMDKVIKAKREGKIIYLVEGEDDVEALESVDQVATSARHGAESLHNCDISPLHGAKIIAIVDKPTKEDDRSGDRWAEQVREMLNGHAAHLEFKIARQGKDVADHLTFGHELHQLEDYAFPASDQNGQHPDGDQFGRHILLTPASKIKPRRVRWLWDARIAIGTLALLAGREGLGKSILAYTLAAMITRGKLPGEHFGKPKAVLVAATEDPWEQTIVPRLIAADADLERVFRVEVMHHEVHSELILPRDLPQMREAAQQVDAVMLILDPLISRLDGKLDSHKDADVRRALEPLVAAADLINITVLGLIHHNKSGSSDPLQVIMASKAFTAVARSVHTVIYDPDDDSKARRLFGTPKNNLGRSDLPTLSFTIDSFAVPIDDGNDLAWTGRLTWGAESKDSIYDAMERASESGDQKSAATDAQHWLEDYLTLKGGTAESAKIKKAAYATGHSERSIRTARDRLKIEISEHGFPRQTWWSLPNTQKDQNDQS